MIIIINGWNKGFNKVEFNRYLRANYGYSIKDAKKIVDDIINNNTVYLHSDNQILDLESLDKFEIKYTVKDKNDSCK